MLEHGGATAIGMVTVGLVLCATAGLYIWQRLHTRRNWYRCDGFIIGTVTKGNNDEFKAPVVSFTGPLGETRTWEAPTATAFADAQVGTTVTLLVEDYGKGPVHLPKMVDPFWFITAFLTFSGFGIIMAAAVLGTEATFG